MILVGTGVVGRAILKSHVRAGVSLRVADLDEASILESVSQLALDRRRWTVSQTEWIGGRLPSVAIRCDQDDSKLPTMVIESIAERLDAKQSFFAEAESFFGDQAILCSNTSTLKIGDIGSALQHPHRLCGLHFFMPVDQRVAVEVVRTESTTDSVVTACETHVRRIGKSPLVVADSPGFIVNRLLSPYLNEALLLLGRRVTAEQIERAALAYGMPMSPLELADVIGTRTMIDAGRAYWQAFPSRFDPSPMLAALIKAKRMGRATGGGFYDYVDGVRTHSLAPFADQLCQRYERNVAPFSEQEVMLLLSIPMWIEAAFAYQEHVAASHEQFDLAMRGGLGYQASDTWLGFFDGVGSARMLEMIELFSPTTKSLRAPAELTEALQRYRPSKALDRFAKGR